MSHSICLYTAFSSGYVKANLLELAIQVYNGMIESNYQVFSIDYNRFIESNFDLAEYNYYKMVLLFALSIVIQVRLSITMCIRIFNLMF